MTNEEVQEIVNWLNGWEQIVGTAIPLRFKEEFSHKPMTPEEREKAVNGFIELTCKHTVQFFRLMGFETHIEATIEDGNQRFRFSFNRLIQLPAEPTEWFPLGAKLTSLENGKLVIAPEGTPDELIVGTVTLEGLKT